VGDMNDGAILNSYATGDVSGTFYLGGLVGSMATSEDSEHILISRSYALGQVTGDTSMGDSLASFRAWGRFAIALLWVT
jgi:hypothetical protein